MLDRLPILATLLGAYGAVFRNLGTIIKATMLPLLAMILVAVVHQELGSAWYFDLLAWALGLPFATLIAVAIHRTVLLGSESLSSPWSLYWSERESSFLAWLIVLSIFFYLASVAFAAVSWILVNPWLILAAAIVFALWLQGRFGMVLPATAVGRRVHLSNSWFLTSGNDVQVIVVLAMPALIVWALMAGMNVLSSNASGFVTMAVAVVLVLVTLAVEIAILSLMYKFLTEEARAA